MKDNKGLRQDDGPRNNRVGPVEESTLATHRVAGHPRHGIQREATPWSTTSPERRYGDASKIAPGMENRTQSR
jgi:hypothetical protein